MDTETSLGFDELKDTLLRPSEAELTPEQRIQNMVNGLGGVKRVVDNVEKIVSENLGFIGVHGGELRKLVQDIDVYRQCLTL